MGGHSTEDSWVVSDKSSAFAFPSKFLFPVQRSQWVSFPRLLWPLTSGALLVPRLSRVFYSETSDSEMGLGNPPVWPHFSPEPPQLFLMTWRFNKRKVLRSGQASLALLEFCAFIQSSRDDWSA